MSEVPLQGYTEPEWLRRDQRCGRGGTELLRSHSTPEPQTPHPNFLALLFHVHAKPNHARALEGVNFFKTADIRGFDF